MLVWVDKPYSMMFLRRSLLEDTRRVVRGVYKTKDSGASISFGGGIRINLHMAV